MRTREKSALCLVLCTMLLVPMASARAQSTARDGTHDFDWDIGVWKVHQQRLLHPLTGSSTWTEYNGTDAVQKIWDGANWGKVESDGPAGHLQIYTLRLYDAQTHKWNVYFGNPGSGSLGLPVVGEFKDGRGAFYDREAYRGKPIMVRFQVSNITPDSCHFEQAFSADDGKTWETNFIADETLLSR